MVNSFSGQAIKHYLWNIPRNSHACKQQRNNLFARFVKNVFLIYLHKDSLTTERRNQIAFQDEILLGKSAWAFNWVIQIPKYDPLPCGVECHSFHVIASENKLQLRLEQLCTCGRMNGLRGHKTSGKICAERLSSLPHRHKV